MLGYKRSLYERERHELARMRRERDRVEQRRDSTISQLGAREREFREKAAVGAHVEDVNSYNYQRNAAEILIKALQEEIDRMNIEIEKQLEIVIQLDKDVKGLEKLREKQWDKYVFEANKEEHERILEIVSTKYIDDQNSDEE